MAFVLRELSPYHYAALEYRQIRLINLQARQGSYLKCTVEILDLDTAPPFTALFYTHGPPVARDEGHQESYDSLHLVPLICDGKELPIKPNLATALEQLGPAGQRWILLDRCSMHQSERHARTPNLDENDGGHLLDCRQGPNLARQGGPGLRHCHYVHHGIATEN